MKRGSVVAIGVLVSAILVGCSASSGNAPNPTPREAADDGGARFSDDERRANAVREMHDVLLVDVVALSTAAEDTCAAAPLPVDRGWDPTKDADAIASMRAAWIRARTAYEHIEGALAPLFPDIDTAIDARYDDFLVKLGPGGDPDAFDDRGVTGMHAVERILFVDTTPPRVVEFEKSLSGYSAARLPNTPDEAASFKNALCARLVADTKTLLGEWTPANIDVEVAYSGLVSLVLEQREKVQKAATNEEESRYSQRTMTDLRDNLTGTKTAYRAFQPWLVSKANGSDLDLRISAAFAALDTAYGTVSGAAIPAPPATWSAENPSASDLATPFGRLYSVVQSAADEADPGSLVSLLEQARALLGLRKLG